MNQNSLKFADFWTQKFVSSHKFDKITIEVNQNLFKIDILFHIIQKDLPWWLRWLSVCLQCGDLGLIPGWGRSHGEGNGNPLQYTCLENPMVGRAWWATVHGVAKSLTKLSDFTSTFQKNIT